MKTLEVKAVHQAENWCFSSKAIHGDGGPRPSFSAGYLILMACLAMAGCQQGASDPMTAAKSYFTAMKNGDEQAVSSASLGTSEQKEWTVMAMRSGVAYEKLDEAASARFGREPTDKAFDEMKRSLSGATAMLGVLATCEVKTDGTNATIAAKPEQVAKTPELRDWSLKLQNVGGQWKVVLDLEVAKQDFNAGAMAALAASLDQCATDTQAGKYKTAEEAKQAMMMAFIAKAKSGAPEQ